MSEEILRKVLLKIAKELNFVDYVLKIEPISSGGANYTSNLYNITLSKSDSVVHMFGKVTAGVGKLGARVTQYYLREKFVYTKILKVYKQLEDDHILPQQHRLEFPKFYGCSLDKYQETVVLEDLAVSGYQNYDRFKTVDWEFAKSAIISLAKLHALSFAYGEYYPEEYAKIVDFKFEWDIRKERLTDYFKSVIARAVQCTREENRDKLRKFFDSFDLNERYNELFEWSRKPVLRHGDYRPNNLMYRTREDGTVDIRIVDLQTLRGGNPIVDLLYFIYTGSDEEFRAQYYDKLLNHYYTELHAAMTRFHLNPDDVYSREDFDYELQEKLDFGLINAVYMLPIVVVEAEEAPEVESNGEVNLTAYFSQNVGDRYTERINGVVNDYVKFGILK